MFFCDLGLFIRKVWFLLALTWNFCDIIGILLSIGLKRAFTCDLVKEKLEMKPIPLKISQPTKLEPHSVSLATSCFFAT